MDVTLDLTLDLTEFEEVVNETQVTLKKRPETKTQGDLDRVVSLGKPQHVIDKFKDLVDLGNSWDWLEDYLLYLNDVDTWEKWEAPEPELDDEGVPLPLDTRPEEPIAPTRKGAVVVSYTKLRTYPPLADFADAYVKMWDGNSEPMEEYVQACLATKAKYPK